MEFGDKIRMLRKQQGLTLEEVGNIVGVGKSTVRKWESGEIANMRRDKIALLAQALHVSPGYLMGWESEPSARPLPANLRPLGDLHRQRVPLIGRVAAGRPIMAEQDFETFVDAPVDCDAALEVQGDSMKPTYLPGDILYIKCRPDVSDGQVAVVLIDDEATLKHVYKRPGGLTLWSDNPEYPPMMIDANEHDYIAVYGVPVGYTRIYRPATKKKIKKGIKEE